MTNSIDEAGLPTPGLLSVYSARLLGALVVAGQVHAGQFRKDTKIPYLSHLRGVGAEVWSRFNAPKKDVLWYYHELVDAYRANPEHNVALVDELERAVSEMERLAEEVRPAR